MLLMGFSVAQFTKAPQGRASELAAATGLLHPPQPASPPPRAHPWRRSGAGRGWSDEKLNGVVRNVVLESADLN